MEESINNIIFQNSKKIKCFHQLPTLLLRNLDWFIYCDQIYKGLQLQVYDQIQMIE